MSPLLHVVEAGTPVQGNDELEKNLVQVEKVAYSQGLPPEAVSIMLEFAMSLRMGKTVFASASNWAIGEFPAGSMGLCNRIVESRSLSD